MNKLKTLNVYDLPLDQHYGYFSRLSVHISAAAQAVKTALAPFMPDFNDWLAKEHNLAYWARKSELTAEIVAADAEMNRLLAAINYAVQIALRSPEQTVAKAAIRIEIQLKHFGRVSSKPYDAQVSDVDMILNKLTGEYLADATLVGLGELTQRLIDAYNSFISLLGQRDVQQLNKPDYSAREVRKGIEEVYHQMVDVINSNSIVGTSPAFVALIDQLNPDIERLNEEYHRAKKDLGAGDHTVIEEIATQQYSGKAITVIPKVYYREDGHSTVELTFAKDFTVTYKNNIEVGMARLTIHGKGKYKGSQTTTFNIART